jgi:hypothetical protein
MHDCGIPSFARALEETSPRNGSRFGRKRFQGLVVRELLCALVKTRINPKPCQRREWNATCRGWHCESTGNILQERSKQPAGMSALEVMARCSGEWRVARVSDCARDRTFRWGCRNNVVFRREAA